MNKKFSLSKTHATMPGLEAEETEVWNPIKQVNQTRIYQKLLRGVWKSEITTKNTKDNKRIVENFGTKRVA